MVAKEVPSRNGLSPDRILATAVGIVDAEGVDALTMRRLAADLATTL